MARIAKSDVHAALRRAADQLILAGGPDRRVSRADVEHALTLLTGVERSLVDLFFRFIDHRDYEPGAVVTVTDVEDGYAYAIEQLIDAYDLDDNGLSEAEVARMSTIGKLAVALALELAPRAPGAAAPISVFGLDPRFAEAQLAVLTKDLQLVGPASSAGYEPVVVPIAPTAPLDLTSVRQLFADVHGDLRRDSLRDQPGDLGPLGQRGYAFDLRDAYAEQWDFGEWLVPRRMPEVLDDPLAVELAVRTGELIDFIAATVAEPRVFAFSERIDAKGRLVGDLSVFVLGRTPDSWLIGVYSAIVAG